MRLPSFCLRSQAPVMWSACTCVSSVSLSLRPSSSRSAASRRACSNTGSINSASREPASASRYVYVDDCGSKSCLEIIAVNNFTPVASLAGGLLIGAASVWLLAANGRIAGISGILHGLFAQPPGDRSWRLLFITGLIAAGFAWHLYAGPAPAREGFGLGWAAAAGLLVGLGTRGSGGCTSGRGVCGLGRFWMGSLLTGASFMAPGIAPAAVIGLVLRAPAAC